MLSTIVDAYFNSNPFLKQFEIKFPIQRQG